MRFKFTVFLLALNAITFGLILFFGNRAELADKQMGGLSGMFGREVIEADRIELRGHGLDAPRVLERNGSSWSITEPMHWTANYFAINRILNQLQFLEEEASFSIEEIEKTGQSLADYGLDDPLLKLTIANGNKEIELSVGTLTEIGNNVYMLGPNGTDIFVVNRKVVGGLLVDLADLRTREIFDIPVFEVDALSLQIKAQDSVGSSDLKVRLARTNNGWIFEAPLSAEADHALVSNTINTLTAAKVGRFIEEEASDPILQGLENPFMRVTLHGNKRRQTLLIGNKDTSARGEPTYFARLEDNPTTFTVLAKPFDELREAQEALRERNFMSFDPAALTSINISENGLQVRLQKLETGDDWQVIESDTGANIQPRRADPQVIDKLVNDLKTLRAKGFAADAPTPADLDRLGFNKARRTVTLSYGVDNVTTLLLAHPETENELLYARSNKAEYIYQVERYATLRMLPLSALHYRNRTLDTLPEAASITALKLENLITGEVIFDRRLESTESRWDNALADIEETDRLAILTLLNSLRKFTVKSYLIDGYSDAYLLDAEKSLPWTFRVSAKILLPGGETARADTRSYVFTKRLSGTVQVGGSEPQDTIFEIPQPMLDALYVLTDDMKRPPEATGDSVAAPEPLAPTPAPAPTIEAAPVTAP
jgi:hypothetical protein